MHMNMYPVERTMIESEANMTVTDRNIVNQLENSMNILDFDKIVPNHS